MDVYQKRGQCISLLLAALNELGGSNPKSDVIRFIAEQRWFELQPEDKKPYPSQIDNSREPRWHTLIAWARKDSSLHDLVNDHEHNSWSLTRYGREKWEAKRKDFESGKLKATKCYLWTAKFKSYMCPSYKPGPDDEQRPIYFYQDIFIEDVSNQY